MKTPQRIGIALVAALGSHFTLLAQTTPVVVEAESATLGADWTSPIPSDAGASGGKYVAIKLGSATVNGSAPGTDARVATYTITFPAAGTYDLYARVRVGAGGANDDSYFYGTTFGTKGSNTTTDWVNANGLSNVGYVAGPTLAVDGGGSAGSGVWKWVDMSKFLVNGSAATTFTVAAGALTQTFQIGAREDGLDFDKFVFGQSGLFFTVANLDAGTQGSTTAPVQFVPAGPPLATGKSKYLGSAYSAAQSPNFTRYWNSVTPENGGKWGIVEGTRGTFNWADLDSAYNRSTKSGGIFRLHTLIWGAQQPAWIASLPAAEQLAAIKTWFAALAARYPKIDFIDVVNEPINTPPTGFVTIGSPTNPTGSVDPTGGAYINALGGTGTTGYDWIITSFQLARQYFPTAKLMINEYSVENSATRAATYVNIINLLKTRGLLDGVGIQGHAFSTGGQTAATINGNMATLAAPGLPLYITEYDSDGVDDAVQLAEYQRVFPLFWENPNVKGITLWGYRPGHWRTTQGAPLVNVDATERPSMVWLRNYIRSTTLGTRAASAATAGAFLYPNPAAGSVALSLPANLAAQAVDVALFNSLGQAVLQRRLPASANGARALPLGGVAPGLYTLRLQTSAGTLSQRLTVQ